MRHKDQWKVDAYIGLLGNRKVLDAVKAGKTVEQIQDVYRPDLEKFIAQRGKYLLYP